MKRLSKKQIKKIVARLQEPKPPEINWGTTFQNIAAVDFTLRSEFLINHFLIQTIE